MAHGSHYPIPPRQGGREADERMAMTAQERAERRAANKARDARIAEAMREVRAVVATGKCPTCGSKLRRNLSIAGWWQCEQLGAVTHRARPADPPCSWQGFTE